MAKKDALTETTDKVNAYVNDQVALAEKCFALYQSQVEKATKLWTDTALAAMTEGQKAAKAWMELGTQVAADARKTCEVNVKEASKAMALTPAA